MAIGDQGQTAPRGHPEPGPDEPLLSNGSGLFEYRNRPRRDTPWLVAYLVVLLGALGGGIFAFLNRNTRYNELLSPDAFSDPALCPISATSYTARRLLQQGPDAPSAFNLDLFMKAAGAWLAASAGGAILVGCLFVWLVKVSPAGMVTMALVLQVSVPAVLGGVALAYGNVGPGVTLLVLAGLTLLLFALWRPQIHLVTSLLGLAGRGLAAHSGLVPLALGLQIVLLSLFELPLLIACIGAFMNGSLVYNRDRADGGSAAHGDQCVGPEGQSVPCCVWQTEPWVPVYLALAGLAMTWSLFLAFQIKLYTVAGAIAQWYFAPASEGGAAASASASGSIGTGGHGGRRSSRTLTALRFAVGPSLGSLCCGAAILTLISMIRQAIEKARQERHRNLIAACAAACLSLLLALVEFVTRFATVRAAVTGEAFMAAGRNVVALLSRNAMDAFGVWWLPPMILQSCCFVLALCWASAVAAMSYTTTWAQQAAASPDQATLSAWLTALVAFLAAWAVLGFLASLLLNVVDALFVCFAMDRDVGQVSWMEAHTVMVKLPTVGPLVQQPDGGLVYGAPPVQPAPGSGHPYGSPYAPDGGGSVARV